jgi:hypothetical protein
MRRAAAVTVSPTIIAAAFCPQGKLRGQKLRVTLSVTLRGRA